MSIPTEWTYGGLLDWTSESIRLAPLDHLIKTVLGSLGEHCVATKIPIPELIAADYNPLQPLCDYLNIIELTVTALIPKFADHTQADVSYSFEGLASIPTFNSGSVCALTTAGVRLATSPMADLAAWFKQQYQILNLLRWAVFKNADCTHESKETGCSQGTSSWADTVAAFNASAFGTISAPWSYASHTGWVNPYVGYPNDWEIERIASYIDIDFAGLGGFYKTYAIGNTGDTWYNADYPGVPYGDSVYHIWEFGAFTADVPQRIHIGRMDNNSMPNPEPGYPDGVRTAYRWVASFIQFILHFSGENGFKFRDYPTEYLPI